VSTTTIIKQLRKTYPDAKYELNWDNPLQLLVATILAAQCPDERVNQVTPELFARYPDARALAEANVGELEQQVKSTGFYRQKAKRIKETCQALVERFDGEVPGNMEDMLTLPGVARKTANVVLGNAFAVASGVIVDSHVARVSQRLGLAKQSKPEKIEEELMEAIPKKDWIHFGCALVLHGRYTCTSNNPKCDECVLEKVCPKIGV
jgi:endonuclease-3